MSAVRVIREHIARPGLTAYFVVAVAAALVVLAVAGLVVQRGATQVEGDDGGLAVSAPAVQSHGSDPDSLSRAADLP